MRLVGIDLAWSPRNRLAGALLSGEGNPLFAATSPGTEQEILVEGPGPGLHWKVDLLDSRDVCGAGLEGLSWIEAQASIPAFEQPIDVR